MNACFRLAKFQLPLGIKIKKIIKTTNKIPQNISDTSNNSCLDTNKIVQRIAKEGLRIEKKIVEDEMKNRNVSSAVCVYNDEQRKRKRTARQQHKTVKINSTVFVCVLCYKKFPNFDELKSHMRNSASCQRTTISCSICSKTFPNKSRCRAHVESAHSEKPTYPCSKCEKSFSNSIALKAHLDTLHTEYFDATKTGFACKICNETTPTKPLILHHINTKHLHITTLLCDMCGKSFMNESGLRAHLLTHNDDKPFMCQICSKSFKLSSTLKAHIKTHSEEKRYVCDECGKAFKKNCTLLEHKKHHAGEYSFECNICSKKFVSKSACNSHIKTHMIQTTT